MRTLAIETSTSYGSIALVEEAKVLFSKSWSRSRSHAEILGLALQECFEESKSSGADIDFFSTTYGPGSFTGLRVALATVKSLAYSFDKPIFAGDSLRLVAEDVEKQKEQLLVVVNAQRNEFYSALFSPSSKGWKESKKPQLLTVDQIQKILKKKTWVAGEGSELLLENLTKAAKSKVLRAESLKDYPSSVTLAYLGLKTFKLNKAYDWKSLDALYIRPSAAEEKLRAGLLKPMEKLL
jgi:tRNA threonylcarbamoyladenosine biosynthesis protein TsaB